MLRLEAVNMVEQEPREKAGGDLDLAALDSALQQLYRTRAQIGRMPPGPATARGRAGAALVRMTQRALFWIWPQLDAFHAAVIEFAEAQAALMNELRHLLTDADEALAAIEQELRSRPAGETADVLWPHIVKLQANIELARHGVAQRAV
jgi:hypothetical protein